MDSHSPFAGTVALVTGVSRPGGIGAAVAHRLHELGATVVASGWPPHDAEMPWGSPAETDLAVPRRPQRPRASRRARSAGR
jgi:3-oxoacyl-[acyl-carrier protein] reductase